MKEIIQQMNYTQYAFFEPESGTKEIIIINFENRAQYNITNISNSTNDEIFYENNANEKRMKILIIKIKKTPKSFCSFTI